MCAFAYSSSLAGFNSEYNIVVVKDHLSLMTIVWLHDNKYIKQARQTLSIVGPAQAELVGPEGIPLENVVFWPRGLVFWPPYKKVFWPRS